MANITSSFPDISSIDTALAALEDNSLLTSALVLSESAFSNAYEYEIVSYTAISPDNIAGYFANGDYLSLHGSNLMGSPSTISSAYFLLQQYGIQISLQGSITLPDPNSLPVGYINRMVVSDGASQVEYSGHLDLAADGVMAIGSLSITTPTVSLRVVGDLVGETTDDGGATIEGSVSSMTLSIGAYSATISDTAFDFELLNSLGTADALMNALLAGEDTFTGTAGSECLFGSAGDDTLDGGAGTDTAVYDGTVGQYGITLNRAARTATVTDSQAGREGTDTLSNVEKLQFGGQSFDLFNPALTSAPKFGQSRDFLFDAAYYLLSHPELAGSLSLQTAFDHYLNTGAALGYEPNNWFDPGYYENRWADLKTANLDDATLFLHYNLYGVWEGRSAGPTFDRYDGNRYLTDYPDVAAYVDAYVNDFLGSRTNGAIAHYIIYGANEGRLAYDLAGIPIDSAILVGVSPESF